MYLIDYNYSIVFFFLKTSRLQLRDHELRRYISYISTHPLFSIFKNSSQKSLEHPHRTSPPQKNFLVILKFLFLFFSSKNETGRLKLFQKVNSAENG